MLDSVNFVHLVLILKLALCLSVFCILVLITVYIQYQFSIWLCAGQCVLYISSDKCLYLALVLKLAMCGKMCFVYQFRQICIHCVSSQIGPVLVSVFCTLVPLIFFIFSASSEIGPVLVSVLFISSVDFVHIAIVLKLALCWLLCFVYQFRLFFIFSVNSKIDPVLVSVFCILVPLILYVLCYCHILPCAVKLARP